MGRAIPITIGALSFGKQGDAIAFFKSMLSRYRIGDRVSPVDEVHLRELLRRHVNCEEKIGVGIAHIVVMDDGYGWKCFGVERTDGSIEDFTYRRCITQIWG